MAVKLDKKLAREFRDRWQQLNSILRMAIELESPTTESNDDDIIV